MLINVDGKVYSLRRLRCFLTSDGVRFFKQLEIASARLGGARSPLAVSEAFTLASEELVRLIFEKRGPLSREAKGYDVFAPSLALDTTWCNRLLVRGEENAVDYVDLFVYAIAFHNLSIIKQSGEYLDNVKLVEDVFRFALFQFSVTFATRREGLLPA